MVRLKECNEQIKYLQKKINNVTSLAERTALIDTLMFYLDMRALLIMQGCKDNTFKEEQN